MPNYLVTLEIDSLVDVEVEADSDQEAYDKAKAVFLEEPDQPDIEWRYESCQVKGMAWSPEELD